MKKTIVLFLVLCSGFLFSKVSERQFDEILAWFNATYQEIRRYVLPRVESKDYANCKRFFNLKNVNLDLRGHMVENPDYLMIAVMSEIYNMKESEEIQSQSVPENCKELLIKTEEYLKTSREQFIAKNSR